MFCGCKQTASRLFLLLTKLQLFHRRLGCLIFEKAEPKTARIASSRLTGGINTSSSARNSQDKSTGLAIERKSSNPFDLNDDDAAGNGGFENDGNPFGYSDNPFGESDDDDDKVISATGNPFGDDSSDDEGVGNPFADESMESAAGNPFDGDSPRSRPVTVRRKTRALAVMRGWMAKYPVRHTHKATPIGMMQKRFFVLSGCSLAYYNKLCNSQGLGRRDSNLLCIVTALIDCLRIVTIATMNFFPSFVSLINRFG